MLSQYKISVIICCVSEALQFTYVCVSIALWSVCQLCELQTPLFQLVLSLIVSVGPWVTSPVTPIVVQKHKNRPVMNPPTCQEDVS